MKIIKQSSPFQYPRNGRKVEYIIIHTPEGSGTMSQAVNFMMSHPTRAAYHEVVGTDRAVLMVDDDNYGHHANVSTRLPNGYYGDWVDFHTYAISLVNKAGNRPPEATIRNGAIRAARACERFGLGADRVLAHKEIDVHVPKRRFDPPGVDMDWFRGLVRSNMAKPQEPQGPGWNEKDVRVATWFIEQLARALRGDREELEAYIGSLRAEEPSAGLHDVLVSLALPPMYKERDS